MALVLTVEHDAWWDQVSALAHRLDGRLTPVVKGNGYGLGRQQLAARVAELGLGELAVGTVYELDPDPHGLRRLVLTPALDDPLDGVPEGTVLTVGSLAQADAARLHPGPLAVKLRSSMQRYGATPEELPALLDAVGEPWAALLHLPLTGTDDDRLGEIEAWLPHLPEHLVCSVSHLAPDAFLAVARRHPTRRFVLRAGTALWHGARAALHLGATVNEVRPAHAGARVGYRAAVVPADGHLAVVSAGSAHGVAPLPDGRSPFHFARHRLTLLEPPHMHSSLVFVEHGQPCPRVGEVVDVQRPLTQVWPDRVVWLR